MQDLYKTVDPESVERWRAELMFPLQTPDAEWVHRLLMQPVDRPDMALLNVDWWPDRVELELLEFPQEKYRGLRLLYLDGELEIQQAVG